MPKVSAGLLMYRTRPGPPGGQSRLQVLLAHPGGPFWKNKDVGAWTIPKGGVNEGEDLLAAARREFEEETGITPAGPFVEMRPVKYKGGKTVHAWCFEGDCDATAVKSNLFEMKPRGKGKETGKVFSFPEIDRAEWFDLPTAREKILPAQAPLLDQLEQLGTIIPP